MTRVAILGASGFLGSHLMRASNEKTFFSASGFSRTPSSGLLPYEDFWENLSQFDVVINAIVSYGRTSSVSAFEANLSFPLEVIRRMVESGSGATFINLDSFFTKFAIPFYSPLRDYSLSKALLPSVARETAKVLGDTNDSASVRFLNIRLEHVYGPDDSPQKFVPWLLGQMKNQVPRIPLGLGHHVRDFIHVRDASSLILESVRILDQLDPKQALEVGTGKGTSVKDFVQLAASISGYEGSLGFGDLPSAVGEIEASTADPYLASQAAFKVFSTIEHSLTEEVSRWK